MGIEGKDKEGNVYRIGNRKLMNSANIEISNIDLKKRPNLKCKVRL